MKMVGPLFGAPAAGSAQSRGWRRYAVPLVGVALATVPLLTQRGFYLSLLAEVFIFAILAISYDLLLGYTGILSFGHALFFGAGAYTAGMLLKHAGWPFWGAVLAALAVAGVLAGIVALVGLRVRGSYFAMVTLALAELGRVSMQKWRLAGGSDGLTGVYPPDWLASDTSFYLFTLGALAVTWALARTLVQSPLGHVLVAIRENEHRAQMLGYNPPVYKLIVMMVSGGLAALAGVLFALKFFSAHISYLSLTYTIDPLLMTIIGGQGTLGGPVIGAAIVRLLGHSLSSIPALQQRWPLLFGVMYIAIVMFFPTGIAGAVRRLSRDGRRRQAEAPAEEAA